MSTIRLPRAVQEANRRADEILEEMNKPEVIPENDPEKVIVEDNTTSEQLEKPILTEQPKEPTLEPTTVSKEKTVEYWEHRTKTLQGMLDSANRKHVLESEAIKRQLESKVEDLEKKIREVPPPTVKYDLRNYFSEADIEKYGADLPSLMLQMATKISEEVSERTVRRTVEDEVAPLKKRAASSEEDILKQRQAAFWNILKSSVPDWQEVNADPAFHQWLGEQEPLVGATRQELLSQAEQTLDGSRVSQIFAVFKERMQQNRTQVENRVKTKVLPDSGSAAPTIKDEAKPMFSADDIRQNYSDYAKGKFRNNLKGWTELESRMNEAIAKGLVS